MDSFKGTVNKHLTVRPVGVAPRRRNDEPRSSAKIRVIVWKITNNTHDHVRWEIMHFFCVGDKSILRFLVRVTTDYITQVFVANKSCAIRFEKITRGTDLNPFNDLLTGLPPL